MATPRHRSPEVGDGGSDGEGDTYAKLRHLPCRVSEGGGPGE
ncbi:hypothetical protein [Streptomyces mangrovisoli]|nr:hypothetical protein [Streptomyces mangrovisoli]